MLPVDTVRAIDRYIGIPVCFFLSLANRVLKLAAPQKHAIPKKILVIQLSEMGATVLARHAIRYITKRFPDVQLFYLMFTEMSESIFFLDAIPRENVLTITSSSAAGFLSDTLKFICRARREGFDAAVDLELFSRYSAILSYLSGAPIRVGFDNFHAEGLYRGSLLTHRVHYNYYHHISLNFLSLFKALTAPDTYDIPLLKEHIAGDEIEKTMLPSSPEAEKAIREKLRKEWPEAGPHSRLIVLNPNASQLLPLRRWPLGNYIALAKRLLEDPACAVVLTGSAAELPEALAICNAVRNPRCINLAGRTTLRELIDLYNIADVLVSNDSAPPHFAACTPIRIIVLFGPETPHLYAPLSSNLDIVYRGLACSPCVSAFSHRKSACTNNLCLQQITVDDVFARIKAYLETKKDSLREGFYPQR